MVERLRRQLAERDALVEEYDDDRRALALLAADTPLLTNPAQVWCAKSIRDMILADNRCHPMTIKRARRRAR